MNSILASARLLERNFDGNRAIDIRAMKPHSGLFAILIGTLAAILFALLSALLLLLNGSLTLILLGSLANVGPDWIHQPGMLQFALLTLPLVMLVAEWMVWDFFCGLFSSAP